MGFAWDAASGSGAMPLQRGRHITTARRSDLRCKLAADWARRPSTAWAWPCAACGRGINPACRQSCRSCHTVARPPVWPCPRGSLQSGCSASATRSASPTCWSCWSAAWSRWRGWTPPAGVRGGWDGVEVRARGGVFVVRVCVCVCAPKCARHMCVIPAQNTFPWLDPPRALPPAACLVQEAAEQAGARPGRQVLAHRAPQDLSAQQVALQGGRGGGAARMGPTPRATAATWLPSGSSHTLRCADWYRQPLDRRFGTSRAAAPERVGPYQGRRAAGTRSVPSPPAGPPTHPPTQTHTWPLSPMSRKQASGKMAAYSRKRLSFLAASCWYSAATAVLGSSGGARPGNHVTTPSHCSSALGPAQGVGGGGWGVGGGQWCAVGARPAGDPGSRGPKAPAAARPRQQDWAPAAPSWACLHSAQKGTKQPRPAAHTHRRSWPPAAWWARCPARRAAQRAGSTCGTPRPPSCPAQGAKCRGGAGLEGLGMGKAGVSAEQERRT